LEVVKIIAEKISGTKKNEERKGLQELRKLAQAKAFTEIVTTEVSRISRNPFEFQKLIEEMSELKVCIHIESLGMKTLDKNGKRNAITDLIIGILSQFAKIEREQLVQRVRSGMERARKRGARIGRPKGSSIDGKGLLAKYAGVVHDLNDRISIRKVAKIHSVSTNTVLKVKQAMLAV
jgi:DNA invertase Pin-like site-specific DNA recombinase